MAQLPELVVRAWRAALDQPPELGTGDCEGRRPGVLGQPVNSLTSLAFVGAGTWVATRARALPPRAASGAIAYGSLAGLVGAGSVAFHGPDVPGAELAHDAPILVLAGVGAGVPLARRLRGRRALPGWSPRLGMGLAATAGVAGVAYATGRTTSPLCRPRSVLQPHGLWHLAMATAMALWGAALWPRPDQQVHVTAET